MEKYFIAEPIMSIDGQLLGVEMLTRFTEDNMITLNPEHVISEWNISTKRMFLYEQLRYNISTFIFFQKQWAILLFKYRSSDGSSSTQ
ncbi:hypothetical protein [Enterobacter hormaechei]